MTGRILSHSAEVILEKNSWTKKHNTEIDEDPMAIYNQSGGGDDDSGFLGLGMF